MSKHAKPPRYMLQKVGSYYVVIDKLENDRVITLPDTFVCAELERISRQKAWNSEKN